MGNRRRLIVAAWLVGAGCLVGAASADEEESVRPAPPPVVSRRDPGTRPLDLSIRARMLGIAGETAMGDLLDLEARTAPSGAGTTRMPSALTQIAPGIYVGVMPLCVPGYDAPGPARRRTAQPRR